MEAFFQVVIFIVIVVASVWSEMSKNKSSGGGDAEFGDLTAIDDFFKQQEKAQKTSQLQQPPRGGFDDDTASLERSLPPLPDSEFGVPRKIQPPIGQPKRVDKKEKKRSKGRDRATLDQKGRALPPASSHFGNADSDEGPCLDEAPTLTGRGNYEQGGFGIARTASTTTAMERRPARRWSRQQLIDAIVVSELMTRYDINRVSARIPDRRR